MKIVGRTEKGFLCEVTEDELAQIDGCAHEFARSRSSAGPKRFPFGLGQEVPISPWWNLVEAIKLKEAELRRTGEQLHALAALITGAWPAITSSLPKSEKE